MLRIEKQLFVIKTRTHQSRKTERPLTDQERLEGWYDGAEHKDRQNNEGHERGRIHSMPDGFILCWKPEAGDQIVAALQVQFDAEVMRAEDGTEWTRFIGAWLDREVAFEIDHERRYVFCDSVLGRSVMLGEDGAEDAFGHDELRRALEYALQDDWRKVQCDYRLAKLPDNLETALAADWKANWPKRCEFTEVRVECEGVAQ
jgi:hypothetical protein